MQKLFSFCFLFIVIFFASCTNNSSTQSVAKEFGEAIKNATPTPITLALTELKEKGSIPTTIESKATDVCKKKGCWMNVSINDTTEMRVSFKDYGFFMPFDIAGKTVLMEGILSYDTTSIDDLKHYAEDAGKTKEEIDAIVEPLMEPTFEASGVKILN